MTMVHCASCEKRYATKSGLFKHIRRKHKETITKKESGPACELCGKTFSRIFNLRRHEKTEHGIVQSVVSKKKPNINCEICDSTFSSRSSLFKHVRKIHGKAVLKCDTCKKFKCATKKSMRMHVKECFNIEPVREKRIRGPKKKKIRNCPLCDDSMYRTKNILLHLENAHQKDVSFKTIIFETESDFDKWKRSEEESVCCSFIRSSLYKNNKGHCIIFTCNRSGTYNVCATKRRSRLVGTKKMNRYCPAQIKALFTRDKIIVKALTTHLGHDYDNKLCHMNITNAERDTIVARLRDNVPAKTILREMKYPLPKLKSDYRRIHLLTLRDIRYIGKKYGVYGNQNARKSSAMDPQTWFEADKSSILYHKKHGSVDEQYPILEPNDFLMIILTEKQKEILQKFGENFVCIDSTNKLNIYEFSLTTVMVLDQLNCAYACCFMLSNRVDESLLTVFFQQIKNEIGPLNVKTFMIDQSDMYLKAWRIVFSCPERKLYSSWHVLRAWRENINNIFNESNEQNITDDLLRKMKKKIYYFLKCNVLEEMDKEIVHRELKSFLEPHPLVPALLKFQSYFQEKWLPTVEEWAYCFREQNIIEATNGIDAFHKILKYLLYGRKMKKLVRAPSLLMEYVNVKLNEEILEEKKGKEGRKLAAIKTRHKKSLKKNCDTVTEEGTCWIIESFVKKGEKETSANLKELYFVQRVNAEEICSNCVLVCTECNCCMHCYRCSCVDYRILDNMCKHIHLVCRFLQLKNSSLGLEAQSTTAWSSIVSDIPTLQPQREENVWVLEDNEDICIEDGTNIVLVDDNGTVILEDRIDNVIVEGGSDAHVEQVNDDVTDGQQKLIDRLSLTLQSAPVGTKIKVIEELARKMDLTIFSEEEMISEQNLIEPSQKYEVETTFVLT